MKPLSAAGTFLCAVRKGCVCAVFLARTAASHAAILSAGDVLPSIPPDGSLPDMPVTVGATSDGSVHIDGGSVLTSLRGIVGRDAAAHGAVAVSGENSAWRISQDLVVGQQGVGQLAISEGGQVESLITLAGAGSIMVKGQDSLFKTINSIPNMSLWMSTGDFQIIEGGKASSTGIVWLRSFIDGMGRTTVDGPRSLWSAEHISIIDRSSLYVTGGGKVQADYISTGASDTFTGHDNVDFHTLVVVDGPGSQLDSTLGLGGYSLYNRPNSTSDAVIRNGATFNGGLGMAGEEDVLATMVVEGAGTTWNFPYASIGERGKATLTIRDGAKAYGGWMSIGNGSGSPDVKVIVEGAGTELHIGSTGGTPPTGLVLGTYSSPGAIEIRDGALVTSEVSEIGNISRQVNRITVRDAGTRFEHRYLQIGTYGRGLLEIIDGAAHGSYVSLGNNYGGVGEVRVIGPNASWNVDDSIVIGYSSNTTGTVRVSEGGKIAVKSLLVGFGSQSTSVLDVDAGSSVDISGELWLGRHVNFGRANMNVRNGAHVAANSAFIGDSLAAACTAMVQGNGSSFTVSERLKVGRDEANSFTAIDSMSLTGGARLEVGQQLELRPNARLTIDAQSRILIGTEAAPAPAGALFVSSSGRLAGDGRITGKLENHGLVTPGSTIGTLNIAGSFSQQPAGKLRIELGGNTPELYDRLAVTGGTSLAGVLEVGLADSFSPALGNVFKIVESTQNVSGRFDQVILPPIPGGLRWDVVYTNSAVLLAVTPSPTADFDGDGDVDGDDLTKWKTGFASTGEAAHAQGDADGDLDVDGSDFLTWQRESGRAAPAATAVPEPATLAMLFSGVLAIFYRRRRKK
jgi:T5SS/PEP-CTERM-associated repeat protein